MQPSALACFRDRTHTHAAPHLELFELVDCRGSWIDDVDETFVRANFKLVHRFFVNVDGTIYSELLYISRKRDWASDACAGAFCSLDYVRCGLVDNAIIKAF